MSKTKVPQIFLDKRTAKTPRKKIHLYPRSLARAVAHAKMEQCGVKRINRRDRSGKSEFSRYWKDFALAKIVLPKSGIEKGGKANV